MKEELGGKAKGLETSSKSRMAGSVKYLVRKKKQKHRIPQIYIYIIRKVLKTYWLEGVRNVTHRLKV